jgi:hypothetical protein
MLASAVPMASFGRVALSRMLLISASVLRPFWAARSLSARCVSSVSFLMVAEGIGITPVEQVDDINFSN